MVCISGLRLSQFLAYGSQIVKLKCTNCMLPSSIEMWNWQLIAHQIATPHILHYHQIRRTDGTTAQEAHHIVVRADPFKHLDFRQKLSHLVCRWVGYAIAMQKLFNIYRSLKALTFQLFHGNNCCATHASQIDGGCLMNPAEGSLSQHAPNVNRWMRNLEYISQSQGLRLLCNISKSSVNK